MNTQPIVLPPGKQANGHAEFYRLPEKLPGILKIFCRRPNNNNDVNIKPGCFLFAHGCCLNDRGLARIIGSPPGLAVTDVPGPPSSVSVSLLITITPPQTSELNIQADCHSTFKAYSNLYNQCSLECGMRDDSDSDNPVMVVLLRPLERGIS